MSASSFAISVGRSILPLVFMFLYTNTGAQLLDLKDFMLLSGPNGPGTTIIGSSITINGGSVGSYKLVQTTGNATINSNIHSGDKVSITNSNIINGRITAANSSLSSGTVISVGSSTSITGNIDSRGNIVIGGGTVSGTVTLPAGNPPPYTYSGPAPTGGIVFGTPSIPTLPVMPAPTVFPAAGSQNITGNITIGPGAYGNVTYGGSKTLTLDGPGIYVFNSFHWTGNSNKLVVNFKNQSGNFFIYVHSDADFGKLNSIISNGGNASRIFLETHGTGSTSSIAGFSFVIANGSSGGGSKWMGSVYATSGGINIGSGTGSSTLTGTLASNTRINIQSGVTLFYSPFSVCTTPNVNAGTDRPLAFTTMDTLVATSTTPGVSFSWQTIGGIITSNANNDSVIISAAGTYIATASTGTGCFERDTVVISARVRNIIGSELLSIYENRALPSLASTPFFLIQSGYVLIDIIVNPGYYTTVLNLLQTAPYGLIPPFGLNYFPNGQSNFIITGLFPIANLLKLNLLQTEINYCRPDYQAFSNIGIVTSAGDTTIRTRLVRSGYDINGNGIKIGVISDSYATILNGTTTPFKTNTAAQDVLNGDLPGDTIFTWSNPQHVVNPNGFNKNVHVLQDFPLPRTDEGRAMAQIIHDVAPGVEIYFRTGALTEYDFAKGIKDLKQVGCKLIVNDMTYLTEPFLKDGIVAKTVDTVTGQGVTYFSSAGNFADQSCEKDPNFVDATAIGFPGKKAHNFGNGDLFQSIKLRPGNYTFVLQWIDNIFSSGEGGTLYDLDFYLTKNTNGTALIGFNRDNLLGDPIEFIPIRIEGDTPTDTTSKDYNILIINNTATGNPSRLKYIAFKRDALANIRFMEFHEGKSTLVGSANSVGAIAVGASRFDKAPPFISPPLIESFSSIGGTKTNGVVRQKPDIVGPDGVNTTVRSGQDYPNSAQDGYSNFFGTSAAAPHVAAAAALIIEGKATYLNQNIVTPAEIKSLLQQTAVDMEIANNINNTKFDFISGFGLVNIDLAMRTFAAPTPHIFQLVVPVTNPITVPGEVEFTVTVKGENFSTNSIIYFEDSALASTIVLDTINGIATAVMPQFEGNPDIRVFTPPRTQNNDGGFSNALHFFEAEIIVQAVNVSKKYGETLPVLDTIITINGKLLQDTTITLSQLGLDDLTLTTTATASSNVGTYIITPSKIFDPADPQDAALLAKYNYTFIPGILTIDKMPLKVTPNDITVMQGKHIGNVTFKYEFNTTNVPNVQALKDEIKAFHEAYVPNNALAVVRDFTKTQADGSHLDTSDLRNLSMIATIKAVNNSRKFSLVGNELVPLTDPNTFNVHYLVDVASESIYEYNLDPTKTNLYEIYPGINKKGLLGASALANNTAGQIEVNGTLVQMVNGTLVQMVNTATGPMAPLLNGQLVQIVNGQLTNGTLVQLVNGTLVQLVNGEFVPIPNNSIVQFVNGTLVQMVNGTLVQLVNGQQVPILNGADVTDISAIPNGTLVQLVNGTLVQMVNGTLVQMVNGTLVQLVNGTLVQLVNGTLVQMVNSSVTGTNSPNNNTAIILDEEDAIPSENNWLGPMFGINMITGLDVGTQWMVSGILADENFDITYGLGKVTINPDPCLLTHTPDNNFGSTANPGTATSLWFNLVTKVSGQLKAKGDYLLFKGATITLNNIACTPTITNMPLPSGKIMADNVSVPFTVYDAAGNIWITKVPLGFSSTSDIFVTGAIINSSTGFVKSNNGAASTVKGMFFSNKNFKDQWAYATAAYQPQFAYSSIADSGKVTSINGNFRAGTPTTQINNLVNGGSGGGGNNYTGNKNSYDKFTACVLATSPVTYRESNLNREVDQDTPSAGEVQIIPNPASTFITLSFVPGRTGNSKIVLFTIDGKKVFETNNGICEAGVKYQKKIDVSNLVSGVYLVRLRNADKITFKKIVINH